MEMAEQSSFQFELQLFNGDAPVDTALASDPTIETTPAEPTKPDYSTMSKDDVSAMLNNYHNPKPVEQTEQEKDDGVEEKLPANVPEDKPETSPTTDMQQVFKIKENGQEKEYTLAQLVERAQKGENYERKTQELAAQRKAYEMAMQQQQVQPPISQPKPEDKLQTLQQQVNEFATLFQQEYGIDFNGFDPTHQVAFYQHQATKQAQEQAERQQQEVQVRQWEAHENKFHEIIQARTIDKEFAKIDEFALQAMYQLPAQGKHQEFHAMYSVYQKIQQRDARAQGQNVQLQPFTDSELTTLSSFYDQVKKDYYAKQFAPKNADKTKRPTPSEKVTPGDKREAPKLTKADYSSMSKSDISSMLNGYLVNKIKNK